MTTISQDGTHLFQQHFDQYIKAYLIERNLSKTVALLAKSFCGFGTGLEERCYSQEEALALYGQDIESAPNSISPYFHKKKIQLIDPDHALVVAEITLSIGISGTPTGGDDQDLFKTVDDAMFHAKKTGKNQIVCV